MQKTNKLKVAAVGAGYFSQFHYDAWTRIESVELVGNCNRHMEGAQKIGKEFNIAQQFDDLGKMLDTTKPDLVDIITPPETHLDAVKICAQFGVDAIVQKPFGTSQAQAREMVSLAKSAGIKLIIHENFRFMPWYRKIKQLLDENRLGTVLNASFFLRPGDGQGDEAYLDRQPYFQKMEKFLVHETAIHLVDTFRYLFGDVNSVYADLRKCNPVIAGEDAGLIIFDMANQVRAVFDGNRLLDHAAKNRRTTMGEMRIEGTKASLRLDGDAQLWLRNFGENSEQNIDYPWQAKNFGGDCVFELIQHVVNHYCLDAPLENQAYEYLANLDIENAIYQANHQAQRVNCHGQN